MQAADWLLLLMIFISLDTQTFFQLEMTENWLDELYKSGVASVVMNHESFIVDWLDSEGFEG